MKLGRHFASLAQFLASIHDCLESGARDKLQKRLDFGEADGYRLDGLAVEQVDDILDLVQALPCDSFLYIKTLLGTGIPINHQQLTQLYCHGVVVNDVRILNEMYHLPAAPSLSWTDFTTNPYILCRSLSMAEHLYAVGCPFITSYPMVNWAIHGRSELVKRFLDIAPIEPPWPSEKSLIEFAVEAGHPETVKVLLESTRFSAVQRTAGGERLESIIGGTERGHVIAVLFTFRVKHAWTRILRHFCPLLAVIPDLNDPFLTRIVPLLLELL